MYNQKKYIALGMGRERIGGKKCLGFLMIGWG
jgi:hypothetical protein